MPRFWRGGPTDAIEIDAVTAYLFSSSQTLALASPPRRGDAGRGAEIVKSVGCLACHLEADEPRDSGGLRRTYGQPLQGLRAKVSADWLFDWVRDPTHFSPDTTMPNLRLSDADAADVAAYLASTGNPQESFDTLPSAPDAEVRDIGARYVPPQLQAMPDLRTLTGGALLAEVGRRIIAVDGCYACHAIAGFESMQPLRYGWGVQRWSDAAMAAVHATASSPEAPGLRQGPQFVLQASEARSLAVLVTAFSRTSRGSERPLTPTLAGRTLVQQRNCVACHAVEAVGGDFVKRVAEPSLGPPLLTPEGSRVQPDWLRAFLRQPTTIRPWLAVRMPTFALTSAQIETAGEYLRAIAPSNPPPSPAPPGVTPAAGRELFDLLKCQQCHVLGSIPEGQPPSNLAPDLRLSHQRLQPEWVIAWLQNPSAILPGTRMPSFWPDYPTSFYPPLERNGAAQVRAIRDHVMSLR
jgi:mono/diheme cytochrome c family protein